MPAALVFVLAGLGVPALAGAAAGEKLASLLAHSRAGSVGAD